MKNLKSLKGNKFDMEKVKGGALPYDEQAKINDLLDTHMTASYVREGSAMDDWNKGIGTVFIPTGYNSQLDN